MQDSGHSTPIDLQKLLTPASDYSQSSMQLQKNKKMYASSYFYSPNHPTVEDQVELARRISSSLSDVKNVKSKGQSMYVNRKKRSVKWIHDGDGQEDEQQQSQPTVRDKLPLKCMMNPGGKLLDYRGVQALGEEPNITPPHPERLYDIVRDLNNQKGRGAEIFAKRRKRSEKWVVDAAAIPDQHQQQQQPQSPSSFGYPPKVKDHNLDDHHLNFQHKPFYEPFDLPNMDYSSPVLLPTTKLSDNLYHGPKISSYQNLTNYNTAPRGWDQSQKVYRPIRFEKPQDTKISYSDF